jgi:hypothetical protein
VRDHVCLLAVSIVRDHVCLLGLSTVRYHVCLLGVSIVRDHVCLLGVSTVRDHVCLLAFLRSVTMVFSGVRVTRSLVLCVCFVDRCLSICTFFLLAIVLSVLLRYTDSGYPFGIFKLFSFHYDGLVHCLVLK